MKAIYLLLFCVLVTIYACEKDKFETKPTIEIKSVNSDVVPFSSDLTINLNVTDKEGDVDDSIFVIRERLNKRAPSPRVLSPVLKYKIPDFPDKSKVEMRISLPYGTALTLNANAINIPGTPDKEPDTLSLRLFVKDKAKNTSDTISRNIIVIRR